MGYTLSGMEPLRLVCTDLNALPVVGRTVDGQRQGFDPDAAALVGRFLQRPIEWIPTEWWEMIPTVMAGRGDAVWCWLTPTPERERLVDFTEPYAFFDDAVLVRADSDIRSPENLRGRVVGVVSGGNSHRVASDRGAVVLPFFGVGDHIGQMVTALRAGRVEAVIDDDSTWLHLRNETDLRVAFSVPTHQACAAAVAKTHPEMREAISGAIRSVTADGSLAQAWRRWIPELAGPFGPPRSAG